MTTPSQQFITPRVGRMEQLASTRRLVSDDGKGRGMRVKNPRLGLTFTVTYRVAELPWIIQWKMMGEGEYVLGLEPANCFPEGQERFARRGLLRQLAPGESFETFLCLEMESQG